MKSGNNIFKISSIQHQKNSTKTTTNNGDTIKIPDYGEEPRFDARRGMYHYGPSLDEIYKEGFNDINN